MGLAAGMSAADVFVGDVQGGTRAEPFLAQRGLTETVAEPFVDGAPDQDFSLAPARW